MSLPDFRNKKVTLLGAGVSNMPLAAYLAKSGACVSVRDKKTAEELGESADALRSVGAELICGEGYLENIRADYVFRSPGFRPDLPALIEAKEHGALISSEMELFLENRPCPVIGITGSDGKTTTTTLIANILRCEAEKNGTEVFLGGNIGEPMLHRIDRMQERDCAVVELSSFQLMSVRHAPDVAVITNITPNHLNWHTDMDEYISAKAKVLHGCARAVLNYDNEITRSLAKTAPCPVTLFSHECIPDHALREEDSAVYTENGTIVFRLFGEKEAYPILPVSDILLPGAHNVENYMAAIAAVRGYASPESIAAVARSFCGVPHRLQLVHESNGVSFYNSSIDSSPTRTAAALSAMKERSLVVILGGYDKNIPFSPLADALYSHKGIRAVVLTGATAEKIAEAIDAHPEHVRCSFAVLHEADFAKAVRLAAATAQHGDAVLLSPACASFDAFANFEKRGERFSEIVRAL